MATAMNRKCGCCGKEGRLKMCVRCKLVDYCGKDCQTMDWKAGHKILCSKVPKAVKNAKGKVSSFTLSDYNTRNVGNFMVTEAQARRGQIMEEEGAQDMCYDAMEMTKGSTEKLLQILRALDTFPLSTEAWGMLGHYYHYEVVQTHEKNCSAEALKMYDIAILCARKLNPTWTENRSDALPNDIENRPYLRALSGRAYCLKNIGKRNEAICQAKQIIRLNPSDNQGIHHKLCTWFLEAKDTEGCTNLLRKYSTNIDTSLAYADVLLQYLRWIKDDAVENDIKKALYVAIKTNPFVPDLIGVEGNEEDDADDDNDGCYSPGGIKEAKMYVCEGSHIGAQKLWGKYPEATSWMKALKFGGPKVPDEMGVITLLQSGITFQMKCVHTDLDGRERRNKSTLIGTQRRKSCFGCGTEDFFWPRQLNQPYQCSSDILVHHNDFNVDRDSRWRNTKYIDVLEVPYWRVLLQFCDDDEDNSGNYRDEPESFEPEKKQSSKYKKSDTFKCRECNSDAKFCALDDCTEFYCSKSCMKNYLQETEPLYFDLNSEILKINASSECSIRTLDLDYALQVAGDHMPNLKAVDIYINQEYVLSGDFNDLGKSLLLSSTVLRQFLKRSSAQLVSFSFGLDDCCWDQIKAVTDQCRALAPLGTMPNLKKLSLTSFGFDDVGTLLSCLSPDLQVLNLGYAKMGTMLDWSNLEVDLLVGTLSGLKKLVSLSLADIPLTDRHLKSLLPHLKVIRCLSLDGTFGDGGDTPLTDLGLKAIANHCPKLLSLSVNYQSKATVSGIMAILQYCPEMVQLEACQLNIGVQHVKLILTTSVNLLNFSFGEWGSPSISNQHEKSMVQNAVAATRGRVVICTMNGLFKLNLSPEHRRNQDSSMAKVERAHEQQRDPMVINNWDGIL